MEQEWSESGTLSGRGVVSNPRGLMTVLETAFAMRPAPIHLIGFSQGEEDVKEWRRILRRTGGEFRELKGEP